MQPIKLFLTLNDNPDEIICFEIDPDLTIGPDILLDNISKNEIKDAFWEEDLSLFIEVCNPRLSKSDEYKYFSEDDRKMLSNIIERTKINIESFKKPDNIPATCSPSDSPVTPIPACSSSYSLATPSTPTHRSVSGSDSQQQPMVAIDEKLYDPFIIELSKYINPIDVIKLKGVSRFFSNYSKDLFIASVNHIFLSKRHHIKTFSTASELFFNFACDRPLSMDLPLAEGYFYMLNSFFQAMLDYASNSHFKKK